jgi:branched-chain amino acid transport system permease protein
VDLSGLPNAAVASVVLAGLYMLVGLSWVLLFRATQIMNFATGQFALLGACLYYSFTVSLHLPFIVGFLGALAVVAGIGAGIHMLFIRRMAGNGSFFAPVVLTLGISTVISQIVNIFYGTGSLAISLPIPSQGFRLGSGLAVTLSDLVTLIVGVVVVFTVQLIVRRTRWGIQMRAAAEDTVLASQSGINVDRVFMWGWAGAAAVVALVGVSYGASTIVTPTLADIGIRGLAVAIVGGFDSIIGLLPAAVIVALAENVSVLFFGESVRDAAVMIIILLVLAIRPQGLLGSRIVARV